MEVLIFDLKGSLAHFRRPDTTATHATYPFITRTALRGVLGATPGARGVHLRGRGGPRRVRLMSPVRKSVQQLSMLGKGVSVSGPEFNRPTAVELRLEPLLPHLLLGPLPERAGRFHPGAAERLRHVPRKRLRAHGARVGRAGPGHSMPGGAGHRTRYLHRGPDSRGRARPPRRPFPVVACRGRPYRYLGGRRFRERSTCSTT